jgi:hypothetical protein
VPSRRVLSDISFVSIVVLPSGWDSLQFDKSYVHISDSQTSNLSDVLVDTHVVTKMLSSY